ncbi:uncharacterized protein I303_101603 [Kwoniella dejecticola CBS 10117]|uniref:CRIB domain-containing protein n=1 Tax=Kwoniella dejecticola CBS 10117 TaxID=1296121 RepID=A0A1A6ADB3_9TREE|nr:uncharacterized protein I303_02263 [Kwoniella dejecticola CBS 10117]OBR88045.1 hypothetical protein I303_02263 [Kwoniella dejecticola CBS 10117]
MSRPATKRSMSSDKALPALPAGGLGLDFSGLPLDDMGMTVPHKSKSSRPPAPRYIPLRQSPIAPTHIPSSPSIISLSPSTPLASSSAYPFPYTNKNYSQSTILNQSTTTLTAPGSPSVSISTTPDSVYSISPKKRVGFGKSSVSADSIRSQTMPTKSHDGPSFPRPSDSSQLSASPRPLRRKGSSGQLLSGIGKGLNRVGSVMRRNTESNIGSSDQSPRKFHAGSWRRGRRKMSSGCDESWEQVNRIGEEADEGDKGIGRPFNVGHDLHVSPDLSDLPEQWLSSLIAQGLTESDLLLISAARKKQHETANMPLPVRSSSRLPKAPLSAPSSRFLDAPFREESLSGSSSEPTHGSLLKKFSFESSPLTTPTATPTKNVSPPHQVISSTAKQSTQGEDAHESEMVIVGRSGRRKIDSFPVSAARSSDVGHDILLFQDQPPLPAHTSSDVNEMESLPRSRNQKRFSTQIQTFRESTFGLGEESDGEWGKSILDQTLSTSASSPPLVESMKDDRIPVPPESPSASGPASAHKRWTENEALAGYKTPSRQNSLDTLPKSPPPPARPRKSPSVTQIPKQVPSPLTPLTESEGREHNDESRNEPRKSSESFGVHYNTSLAKSKSSVGSEIITPSLSMEDNMDSGLIDGDDHDDESRARLLSRDTTFGKIPLPDYSDQEVNGLESESESASASNTRTHQFLVENSVGLSKYHSNPHLSLPASAIDSRSTTPDIIPEIPSQQAQAQVPFQGNTSKRISLKPQASYSTFSSEPYKSMEEDDLLDGLDRANPEERASIALSILSSRTSTSAQSLHELREATVRTAYKLTPVNELYDEREKVWNSAWAKREQGQEARWAQKEIYSKDKDAGSHDSTSSDCRGSPSLRSTTTTTGWEMTSDEYENGSEGTNVIPADRERRAKDAMDALGEAARRLKGT